MFDIYDGRMIDPLSGHRRRFYTHALGLSEAEAIAEIGRLRAARTPIAEIGVRFGDYTGPGYGVATLREMATHAIEPAGGPARRAAYHRVIDALM